MALPALPTQGGTDWYAWGQAIHAAVTASVSGTGVTAIVKLTQAAYDALGTKDPATLYVIQG